jgi:polyhydroxyalkanoate synthesis regulator phasin
MDNQFNIEPQEIPLFDIPNSGNENELGSMSGEQPQERLSEGELKFRAMQSERDQLRTQLEQAKQAQDLWDEFVNNGEVRKSLIAELEPDLYKPQNPTTAIQEQLKKEFGENYEDLWDSGSVFQKKEIDARYNELRASLSKNSTAPKPYKELITEKKTKRQQAEEAERAEIMAVRNELQMDDNEWKGFMDYTAKLNLKHIANQYVKATRSRNTNKANVPNFINVTGAPSNKPTEFDNLNKVFGNPQQEFGADLF